MTVFRAKNLTEEQERKFLEFIAGNTYYRKHYDAIYVLLNTGLRISELAGLTISDIDFENKRIRVDHQLLKYSRKATFQENGNRSDKLAAFAISETKTSSGIRYIPMTTEVSDSFRRIIENREKFEDEPVIDGRQGFLFLSKSGVPVDAHKWEHYFRHICNRYNDTHEDLLPKITPHVCRHTFCSKMARSGMNPKILQYIMGHSNINMTMNVYTHVNCEDVTKEMDRLREKDY